MSLRERIVMQHRKAQEITRPFQARNSRGADERIADMTAGRCKHEIQKISLCLYCLLLCSCNPLTTQERQIASQMGLEKIAECQVAISVGNGFEPDPTEKKNLEKALRAYVRLAENFTSSQVLAETKKIQDRTTSMYNVPYSSDLLSMYAPYIAQAHDCATDKRIQQLLK